MIRRAVGKNVPKVTVAAGRARLSTDHATRGGNDPKDRLLHALHTATNALVG